VHRLVLLHHILHIDRSGDWWLQFQVRPSSDAFASFRSAGVNALADDFFKVRALIFYASYMSQVMPFSSTRSSMHGHTYHLRIRCQQGCPEPSHSFINTSMIAALPFMAMGLGVSYMFVLVRYFSELDIDFITDKKAQS